MKQSQCARDNWNHLLVFERTQSPRIDCVFLPIEQLKGNYEKMIDSPLIVNLTCGRLCLTQPIEYLIDFGCIESYETAAFPYYFWFFEIEFFRFWMTSIACEVCFCFGFVIVFSFICTFVFFFISSLDTIKFLIYSIFFLQMRKHVMNM